MSPDILEAPFCVTENEHQLCKHPKSTLPAYLNGY